MRKHVLVQTFLILVLAYFSLNFEVAKADEPSPEPEPVSGLTPEPTGRPTGPSPGGPTTLQQCYKDVRDTCNCGLVQKGSPCVLETVIDICQPARSERKTFKLQIRKRYSSWCREQFRARKGSIRTKRRKKPSNFGRNKNKKPTRKDTDGRRWRNDDRGRTRRKRGKDGPDRGQNRSRQRKYQDEPVRVSSMYDDSPVMTGSILSKYYSSTRAKEMIEPSSAEPETETDPVGSSRGTPEPSHSVGFNARDYDSVTKRSYTSNTTETPCFDGNCYDVEEQDEKGSGRGREY